MDIDSLTFGVELECYLPAGQSRQAAAQAVSQRIGETVISAHYGHGYSPNWMVKPDGSLRDHRAPTGCADAEFVSPKLQGEAGLAQLAKVCEALTDFGCTVTFLCGFHVHIGAAGIQPAALKKLVRLYQTYEPIIDRFMPASRRASTSNWCRSVTAAAAAAINDAPSIGRLATVIGTAAGLSNDMRYVKLNLAAYARHQTVEFRQHSGTLDVRKTRNWVLTCLRMVVAAQGDINFGNFTSAINRARPYTKTWQIGQMLLRENGATGPEICAAMNWPSVSVPAQARACGLEVYTQRTGRVVRYFVRRAQAEASASLDISLAGFCRLINSTVAETEYLRDRTTNLSGATPWAA
jgi:hypothetical protein